MSPNLDHHSREISYLEREGERKKEIKRKRERKRDS
jgi:hypothetical protein